MHCGGVKKLKNVKTCYKISDWQIEKKLTEIGEKCLKNLPDHEMNHENKYRKGQVCKD